MPDMKTLVTGPRKEVIIAQEKPTVIIGERINPTGKEKLKEALLARDFEFIRQEAIRQLEAGAEVLDVNVGAAGVNEVEMLPEVVRVATETTGLPLCIDSSDPEALSAALQVYKGKPLINSVTGAETSLKEILPLVKEYGAAVVGLCMDERGIPERPEERLKIAYNIVNQATKLGIPQEDVVIDCLAMAVSSDTHAAKVTLETISLVKEKLGNNVVLGASNSSYGLPDRKCINMAFCALAISKGMTVVIIDPTTPLVRRVIRATDLLLGYDEWASRYIADFRAYQV